MIILEKKIVMFMLYMIIIIGAIFCQVNKIRQLVQSSPSITSGNQEWKGAAPSLVKRAEFRIIIIKFLESWGADSLKFKNIIIANNTTLEARAWVIKYFKADSEGYELFELVIKGIIDKRLISNPIHILNHEYDEIVIRVPIIKVKKNKIL